MMANETPLGPFVYNRPTIGWARAMGSSHNRIRTYDLFARCCHGAFYAVGFLTITVIFMAALWIVWCYFGLSMVQVSTGQRRALVNYSLTTAKPQTSIPSNQTTSVESSLNTISKSVTTSSSFHRGASRGESQLKYDPDRKDISRGNSSWAKGDFASRKRAPPAAKDLSIVSTASPLQNSKSDDAMTKDVVPSAEIKDDGIQTRRVASSNDNRHDSDASITNKDVLEKDNSSIIPVKGHDPVLGSNITPNGDVSREEMRISSREYPKPEGSLTSVRDGIQSSRRPDADTVPLVPNFDQDSPRPYVRERTRYDEDDEGRGSRSQYDSRDRGRDRPRYIDDRYSKGDTKLSPEGSRGRTREEIYSDDRYDDFPRRRGDGDRIKDSDERYSDRYRDEIPRYRDDDPRYLPREDRDEERYKARYEDRYRTRDDRIYRSREDDKYRTRYEDRDESRIDDRDRPRIDGRQRPRIDDRDRPMIDDRDRPVITDGVRPIISDRDRTIIRDRDTPIINDRDRSSIVDRDRPIISDRDRPIIVDRDRPRIDDRDRVKIDGKDISRIDDRKDGSKIIDPKRSRIEDRIKDDDKDLTRIDDRYRTRVESVERPRVALDEDREYRRRGDDRDALRDEDDYRSRVESRRRTSEDKFSEEYPQDTKYSERRRYGPRDEEDRYKDDTRTIRRDYIDPVSDRTDDLPPLERIPLPVRKSSSVRGDRDDDYPIRGSVRSNLDGRSRTLPETRLRDRDDEFRRPSRYDDRDRISPTRVRDDTYSTSLDSRHRADIPLPIISGSRTRDRYPEDSTRMRDTKYYDDGDRKRLPSSLDGSSRRLPIDDRGEYKTKLPGERVGEEVVLDRRSYASEEDDKYRDKSNSRAGSFDEKTDTRPRGDDDEYERRRRTDEEAEYSRRRKYDIDDDDGVEYPRRRKDDDEEFRRERPRVDYDTSKTPRRDSYDEYSRDDDGYDDDRTVRRYDDTPRSRDEIGLRKDERPHRVDDRPSPALDRVYPLPKADEADASRSTIRRDAVPSSGSRAPIDSRLSADSARTAPDPVRREYPGEPRFEERPLSVKDVIQAASRHSHQSDSMRKVSYPVFDPRVSNLTSPEIIRPSERRGSTILSRRKRRLIISV